MYTAFANNRLQKEISFIVNRQALDAKGFSMYYYKWL